MIWPQFMVVESGFGFMGLPLCKGGDGGYGFLSLHDWLAGWQGQLVVALSLCGYH